MRFRSMLAGLLIAVLAAIPCQLAASDAAELPWSAGFGVGILPTVYSLKTSEAPKIDADFSDRCWKEADWVSSFVEAAGRNRAQFQTDVAVSHDDQNPTWRSCVMNHEPGNSRSTGSA